MDYEIPNFNLLFGVSNMTIESVTHVQVPSSSFTDVEKFDPVASLRREIGELKKKASYSSNIFMRGLQKTLGDLYLWARGESRVLDLRIPTKSIFVFEGLKELYRESVKHGISRSQFEKLVSEQFNTRTCIFPKNISLPKFIDSALELVDYEIQRYELQDRQYHEIRDFREVNGKMKPVTVGTVDYKEFIQHQDEIIEDELDKLVTMKLAQKCMEDGSSEKAEELMRSLRTRPEESGTLSSETSPDDSITLSSRMVTDNEQELTPEDEMGLVVDEMRIEESKVFEELEYKTALQKVDFAIEKAEKDLVEMEGILTRMKQFGSDT